MKARIRVRLIVGMVCASEVKEQLHDGRRPISRGWVAAATAIPATLNSGHCNKNTVIDSDEICNNN